MRATGNGVFSQCLVGTLAAALTAAITPACGGASERPVGRNPPSRPAGLDAAQPALDARSIEDMNASDLTTSETGRPEMSPTTQDAAVVDDASDPSADAGVDASDTGQRPRVVQITAGRDHTCVLIDDGRVKCWGRNSDGQLGLGDTKWRGSLPSEMGNALPYVDLGSGRKAISVQAAHNRTCVLLDDHTMKCWGLAPGGGSRRGTLPGEMGDNLPIMKLGPGRTVAQLGVARYMVCALLDNQGLSCWDSLNEAAVVNLAGLGRPVQFAHLSGNVGVRFDDGTVRHVQYEGIGKPRFAGRVPLTNRARYIGGYETRSCAILVSGATECWEHANSMSLDSPSPFSMREAATFAHGESFRCVVGTDSIAACWGYGFAAGAPVPLPSSPITLVAGWDHVCALLVDDTVRCWGRAASSDPRYGGSSPGPTAADPWPAVDLGTRP